MPRTSSIYDLYSRFYNILEVFFRGRLARALALPFRAGDRVLDIGVGTGFSLRHYPSFVHVTGIDTSPKMLAMARRKVAAGRVQAQVDLVEADALALPFADQTFDVVVLTHVIPTVHDPDRCLAEAARVAREGGTLVLLNHFKSELPLLRKLERSLNPICVRLGWRTNISLGGLMYRARATYDPAMRELGLLFDIVYLQKHQGKLRTIRPAQPAKSEALIAAPVPGEIAAAP